MNVVDLSPARQLLPPFLKVLVLEHSLKNLSSSLDYILVSYSPVFFGVFLSDYVQHSQEDVAERKGVLVLSKEPVALRQYQVDLVVWNVQVL